MVGLFDVSKVLIPGLQVQGVLLKAVVEKLEYIAGLCSVFISQLVLQGFPSLRCLLASKEQDMSDLVFLRCVGNYKVLLEPLCVEGPGSKLVLSVPIYMRKHLHLVLQVYWPWSLLLCYFTSEGYGSPAIRNACQGQLNGSIDVMLDTPVGGTVLHTPLNS